MQGLIDLILDTFKNTLINFDFQYILSYVTISTFLGIIAITINNLFYIKLGNDLKDWNKLDFTSKMVLAFLLGFFANILVWFYIFILENIKTFVIPSINNTISKEYSNVYVIFSTFFIMLFFFRNSKYLKWVIIDKIHYFIKHALDRIILLIVFIIPTFLLRFNREEFQIVPHISPYIINSIIFVVLLSGVFIYIKQNNKHRKITEKDFLLLRIIRRTSKKRIARRGRLFISRSKIYKRKHSHSRAS